MSDMYLIHHGVKGQKWGVRRYQNPDGSYKKGAEGRYDPDSNSTEKSDKKKFQLSDKQKKALKVGMTVAGVALATYGTYKLAGFVQITRNEKAMKLAYDYVNKNLIQKVGESRLGNGQLIDHYQNGENGKVYNVGRGDMAVRRMIESNHANVKAEANRIYNKATGTKLDKGLNAIVRGGENVKSAGNAAKNGVIKVGTTAKNGAVKVGNSAKRIGTKTKNSVLDVVNPIYEYVPSNTNSFTRNINGLTYKESVTNYDKVRRKRR